MRSAGAEVRRGVVVGPGGHRIGLGVAWPWKHPPAQTSGRALLQLGQLGELLQCHGPRGLGGLHVRFHLLQVPLELGPPVLKPGDDLSVGQTELLGDLVPVRRTQVLLVQEAFLQLVDLVVGKRRAGLPPLLRGVPLAEERQTVSA